MDLQQHMAEPAIQRIPIKWIMRNYTLTMLRSRSTETHRHAEPLFSAYDIYAKAEMVSH